MTRVASKKLGLVLILLAPLAALGSLPFSETPPGTPRGLLAFVRSAEVHVSDAVAVPQFTVVQKGAEDRTARVVTFEGRKPQLEFPSSYGDSDVAKVLEAAFPSGRSPLLDSSVQRVRFTRWLVEREAIYFPYRFFLLLSALSLTLGMGVVLWPREKNH